MGLGLCFWTCAKPTNIEVKRSRGLYWRLWEFTSILIDCLEFNYTA
jgi:hypothetical protein